MATVTGLTAERMLEIEAQSVIDGEIIAGDLILQRFDGSPINAGSVIGPQGPEGDPGQGVPVGGSTGEVLAKNSATNYDTEWISIAGVTIGTAFPGSPVDGQEFILVDSLTVPTYAWRFKYLASIDDSYKWLFIGGSPMVSEETGSTATAQGNVDILQLIAPRAGIYEQELSCAMTCNNGQNIELAGLAGATARHVGYFTAPHTGNDVETQAGKTRHAAVAASTSFYLRLASSALGSYTRFYAKHRLIPVRVS